MRPTLAAAALILLAVAGPHAQSSTDVTPGPAASGGVTAAASSRAQQPSVESSSVTRLRARLLERWRVIRTRGGLVLTPRRASADLPGVELTNGQIYINGEPASGADLRARLGADADAVLALSYLDEATRTALFETPKAVASAAPQPATVAPESETGRVLMRRHGARIRIGSDLTVGEHERIEEAAVAILGSANIEGDVGQDVVAVGGSVRLGPRAVVHGDVTAIGGRIQAEPGARVLGKANEVAIAWPDQWGPVSIDPAFRTRIWPDWPRLTSLAFTGISFRLGVIAILGLIAVLVGGKLYAQASAQAAAAPWQSMIVGVGAQLVLAPLLLILCVTLLVSIIGIPLLALVPLGLIVLGVLWLIGFAAVAERVGRRVAGGLTASALPPPAAFLIGFVLLSFVAWVARAAWWAGWIWGGTALLLGGLGALIEGLAWAAGLGAMVLAWLRREQRLPAAVTPPPLATAPSGPAAL